NDGPEIRPKEIQIVAAAQKITQQTAAFIEIAPGFGGNLRKPGEGDNAHLFGGIDVGPSVDIVELPHAVCQVFRGQNPAASESAQAIRFSETVGDDESFGIDVEGRAWLSFKKHFAVDFVHEHIGADLASEGRDLAELAFRSQCSTGVVQIAEYDHARA